MNKQKALELFRNLINQIYNSPDLTNEILDEIETDLKKIDSLLPKKQYYRELMIFLDKAREIDNIILRNNYKFLFLSNLEKRYQMLKNIEE